MAGSNQRKVAILIGAAMGLVAGIYFKTLQAIGREVLPGKAGGPIDSFSDQTIDQTIDETDESNKAQKPE